jgi:choline dehydrogenase-like flavoprotein
LSGHAHPEDLKSTEMLRGRAEEWLREAGAAEVWSHPQPRLFLSGGQHQAGTCRMSADPSRGVTDKWGKVWHHTNLHVMDGSLHVTNGGFNPVLTIMALAFRNAEHLAERL